MVFTQGQGFEQSVTQMSGTWILKHLNYYNTQNWSQIVIMSKVKNKQ